MILFSKKRTGEACCHTLPRLLKRIYLVRRPANANQQNGLWYAALSSTTTNVITCPLPLPVGCKNPTRIDLLDYMQEFRSPHFPLIE
jgi:hypothetical protein